MENIWKERKGRYIKMVGYIINLFRVPEGREKEGGVQRVFQEITFQSLPKLVEDINLQIQEAELTPNRVRPKKSMPRNIIIKLLKTKFRHIKKKY